MADCVPYNEIEKRKGELMLDETLDFIARRVQKLRDTKGVSARDMSLSLGQNTGYINKIETKQAKPSIDGLVSFGYLEAKQTAEAKDELE